MANNKMSATPPSINANFEAARNSFIKEAGHTHLQEGAYPWEDGMVREDVRKAFTVTLSEPYILKMKYISEKTNKSQQRIAREALYSAIDQLLLSLV